jgi:hypothetical protein
MLMNIHDVIVEEINGDDLYAVCTFSAITDEWPPILTKNFSQWQFVSQEVLADRHIGHFAGRARYVKLVD